MISIFSNLPDPTGFQVSPFGEGSTSNLFNVHASLQFRIFSKWRMLSPKGKNAVDFCISGGKGPLDTQNLLATRGLRSRLRKRTPLDRLVKNQDFGLAELEETDMN